MENLTEEQQQYVDGLIATEQEKVTALQAELDKLKQPETEQEKQIKQLQAQLLQTKVVAAFQQAELSDFVDFVSIAEESELDATVKKLKEAVSKIKVSSSYKPDNHRQTDAWAKAEAKGDVIGMLDAKLSKIFN